MQTTEPTNPSTDGSTPLSSGTSVPAAFDALLKHPAAVIAAIRKDEPAGDLILKYLALALGGFLVFGITLGGFSLGDQLWAAPMKTMLGITLAAVICLPSLYVFSALSGTSLRLPAIVLGLAATLALTGALLLSFTPVLWVFSQSTDSEPFFGFLVITIWLVSLAFGTGLLLRMQAAKKGPVRIWIAIFLLVTLQMSTTLRPLIGTSEELFTTEKRFFLEHWIRQMVGLRG